MENEITETDIKEFKNLAMAKKASLKYKNFYCTLNDEYKFRIGGIGNKSIKLELYLNYETILENKNTGGVEEKIYNKLMEIPKDKINTRLGKW